MRAIKKAVTTSLLYLLILIVHAGISNISYGANYKFIIIVYDEVTFAPVIGVDVELKLEQKTPSHILHQQNYITNTNGEVSTPGIQIPDFIWFTYTVTLLDCNNDTIILTDSLQANQNDTLFKFIGICHTVPHTGCTASFTFAPDSANPLLIHFQNTSVGNPTTYNWNFGDGTTSSNDNPSKQYNSPGAFFVCLTVSDTTNNCQNTYCSVVNILHGADIKASFNSLLDSFAVTPRLVHFINQSESNIPINHYYWDFGDNNYASIPDPTHQYAESGSYTACLIAGHYSILHDTVCKTIIIPEYHSIWGQILSGTGTINSGKVYLINTTTTSDGYDILQEINIGNHGLYYFINRISHKYLIRYLPDINDQTLKDYMPTYSGNNIFWHKSSTVNLIEDLKNHNINLVKRKNINVGVCNIEGTLQYSTGELAAKATVFLMCSDLQKPLKYCYTDSAGSFSFNKLPFDSYYIIAEVPGIFHTPVKIELTPQNPAINDLKLLLSPISTTEEIFSDNTKRIKISPNPASSILKLSAKSIDFTNINKAYFTITDIKGKIVMNIPIMHYSTNEIIIDIRDLPDGIYIINFFNQNENHQLKFIKIN